MRRLAIAVVGIALLHSALCGAEEALATVGSPDAVALAACVPSPAADMATFKATYRPVEYQPPARLWCYVDVAALVVLLVSGAWLMHTRQSARWIRIQLAVALMYFGLFRGGCICPVGSVANISLGLLHPEQVGWATLALFILPLLAAIAAGRIYCGAVCPLGAIQHLLSRKEPLRQLPRALERLLGMAPVLVLVATLVLASRDMMFLICWLDPFKPVFSLGHAWAQKAGAYLGLSYAEPRLLFAYDRAAWAILASVILLGILVKLPFCRFVCPYGVLLGLVSKVAFWRRQVEPSGCVICGQCASSCPTQAINIDEEAGIPTLSAYRCVQCGQCSTVCRRGSITRPE